MAQSACPTGTYQTLTTGATTCNVCDAGKSCLTTTGTPADCASGSFSPAGAYKCDTPPSGYVSMATTGANLKPCAEGEYHDSTTNTCKTCGVSNLCSDSKVLTAAEIDSLNLKCPMGFYPDGKGCQPLSERTQFYPNDAA